MNSTEAYNEAIARLTAYIEEELDSDKCDAADAAMTQLNLMRQEEGFDEITNRTANLQAIANTLQSMIDNVETGGPVSDAINEVKEHLQTVNDAIGAT